MPIESLTLVQQRICCLSPEKIGISQEAIMTVASVRDEEWNSQPPNRRCANVTNNCPFATRVCRYLKINCPAVACFNEVLEDEVDPEIDCDKIIVDQLEAGEEDHGEVTLLPLTHVICVMALDLENLSAPAPNKQEIVKALAKYRLTCNPNPTWVAQRVLTIRMQKLMKCSLSDIGVSIRDMEALEAHVHPPIIKLADLLAVPWDRFRQFALPVSEGGIPNFGPGAIRDIEEALAKYGFFCPPGTEWIDEQDTEEYIREEYIKQQAEQSLPGHKRSRARPPR